MKFIAVTPESLDERIFKQVHDLIIIGGEVNSEGLKERLMTAHKIGILLSDDDDVVVGIVAHKNPNKNYRDRVFIAANVGLIATKFTDELGYIVINQNYRGQGLCQKLISDFLPLINSKNLFATSRKPEMIHILEKVGFAVTGDVYKKDLRLLTLNSNSN